MNKIRLGVIFGGKSSEYGVSLHSAGSLLRQIDDAKYTIIMIGITKERRLVSLMKAISMRWNTITGSRQAVRRAC